MQIHTFFYVFKIILKQIMKIMMRVTGEKTNYLIVPENILSVYKVNGICMVWHTLPSTLVSCYIGVKILPNFWPYYASELDKNGEFITLSIILIFIPIAILNGIIIEKILGAINPKYINFKKTLSESDNWESF